MAELFVLFILYIIAAIAAGFGADTEFTLFLLFAALLGMALRRHLQNKKQDARWQELSTRLKGVELNQHQLRESTTQKLAAIEKTLEAALRRGVAEVHVQAPPIETTAPRVVSTEAPPLQQVAIARETAAAQAEVKASTVAPFVAPAREAAPPSHPVLTHPTPPPPATAVTTPTAAFAETSKPPALSTPPPPAATAASTSPAAARQVAPPPPTHATVPSHAPAHTPSHVPAKPVTRRSLLDFEEMLGTDWAAKLGVSFLVLGIIFLLAYAWNHIGPAGRVLIGYAAAGLMLFAGTRGERSERYRNLGHAGIGGGWATAFITTYAMYFMPGSQVLTSQAADLVLLLMVSAAMVWHTLRYRSQAVTGMAFLLAFTTIVIGHSNTVYSLSAGVMLTGGLVVLVRKYAWFELEVFGILASYLAHYYWLRDIIEPMGARHHNFPEFFPSAAILMLYWALYRGSYLLRHIKNSYEENVSTIAALLNTFLLLGVLRYQSVHKEWAFWALLVLGTVELGLGQLPIARKRRMAFVMLSTLGVLMLVAAFPFRYSGMHLSVLWLIEAEALLLAGVFAAEILFRRFGMIASLLTACHLFFTQFGDAGSNPQAAQIFGLAALLFYTNAIAIPLRWRALIKTPSERSSFLAMSYGGCIMLFTALWLGLTEHWIAPAWALSALALAFVVWMWKLPDLRLQSHAFALAGFGLTLYWNYDFPAGLSQWNLRVITVSLVAACLYGCAALFSLSGSTGAVVTRAVHNWAASFLLVVLAYEEYPNAWLAVVWMAFALLLTLAARVWKLREFLGQAALLSSVNLMRIIFVNLQEDGRFHGYSLRLITVGLVIVGYYALAWLIRDDGSANQRFIRGAYTWVAAGLFMTLAWYELRNPNSVAVIWTLFGVLLFEVGMSLPSLNFRLQGYAALLASFVRCLFVNMNAPAEAGLLSQRLLTVLPLVAAFFYVYARLDSAESVASERERGLNGAQLISYFGTATLALLLYFELAETAPESVVIAWSALVWLLVGVAWLTKRMTFLHQGALLSAIVLLRGGFYNLYEDSLATASFYHGRWFTVGAAAVLLWLALPFVFQLHKSGASKKPAWLERYADKILFFVPLLLVTALLERQISSDMLVVAWGVEAVIVFVFALMVRMPSYRWASEGLLLLCLLRFFLTMLTMEPLQRIISCIVLGALLIGVYLLWTRYQETMRKYI